MVLADRQKPAAPKVSAGASVRIPSGLIVGIVVEVSERCVGVLLENGLSIWLGRQLVSSVAEDGITLAANLLRKTSSLHDGLHIHPPLTAARLDLSRVDTLATKPSITLS